MLQCLQHWTLFCSPDSGNEWGSGDILSYSNNSVVITSLFILQAQYFTRHPLGVIPVEINDLFFSLHGLAIMLVVTVQCLIFEVSLRAFRDQKSVPSGNF